MNNRKQYDFFLVGQRHARDGIEALRKMAASYEKNFGAQAREDFELGIASVIPQYSNFFAKASEKEEIRTDGATTNYGVENTRNNSYFGGTGVGKQFVEVRPNVREYNDPEKKSSRK